jgi:hypothetical protein
MELSVFGTIVNGVKKVASNPIVQAAAKAGAQAAVDRLLKEQLEELFSFGGALKSIVKSPITQAAAKAGI